MKNKFLGNLTLADKVTLLRIFLIPIFVSIMFYFNDSRSYLRYLAIAVFALAVLTDFFDGLVARIKKEKSAIGMIIDPIADKLLLLTVFLVLYALRAMLPLKYQLPLGLVLLAVSRDMVILFGVISLSFLKVEVALKPSYWGKLTTFFQMATILAVLTDFSFFPYIWPLAAGFTLISGLDYFSRGVYALNNKAKNTVSN